MDPKLLHRLKKDALRRLKERNRAESFIQCDVCKKWRNLPLKGADLSEFSSRVVTCEDIQSTCTAPQEEIPESLELDMVSSNISHGTIVMAKVTGHQWWPAMVDDDPELGDWVWPPTPGVLEPNAYHVTFMGSFLRAWVSKERVKILDAAVMKAAQKSLRKLSNPVKVLLANALQDALLAKSMDVHKRRFEFSFVRRNKNYENIEVTLDESLAKLAKNEEVGKDKNKPNIQSNSGGLEPGVPEFGRIGAQHSIPTISSWSGNGTLSFYAPIIDGIAAGVVSEFDDTHDTSMNSSIHTGVMDALATVHKAQAFRQEFGIDGETSSLLPTLSNTPSIHSSWSISTTASITSGTNQLDLDGGRKSGPSTQRTTVTPKQNLLPPTTPFEVSEDYSAVANTESHQHLLTTESPGLGLSFEKNQKRGKKGRKETPKGVKIVELKRPKTPKKPPKRTGGALKENTASGITFHPKNIFKTSHTAYLSDHEDENSQVVSGNVSISSLPPVEGEFVPMMSSTLQYHSDSE